MLCLLPTRLPPPGRAPCSNASAGTAAGAARPLCAGSGDLDGGRAGPSHTDTAWSPKGVSDTQSLVPREELWVRGSMFRVQEAHQLTRTWVKDACRLLFPL